MSALLEFKNGITYDPRGSLDRWGPEPAKKDPCSDNWPHVQCRSGRVVALFLGHLGLQGTITPALYDMDTLSIL